MVKRDFTFSTDFWEAAQCLQPEQRKDFIWAIASYAFTGEEPAHDSPIMPMFILVRGRVESSIKMRNRDNPGGRPRKDAGEHEKEKEKEKEKEYHPVKPQVKTSGFSNGTTAVETPKADRVLCPKCNSDFLSGPVGSRRCFAAGCGYVEGSDGAGK